MTRAYYNEIDPYAAQWIRNLIDEKVIPKGDVDTRSIVDVSADDLKGYMQCHFFAGVAGWAIALRQAGWPDDREIWSGSCPCQPFSVAGKGDGKDDPRHLWPTWYDLIRERVPPTLFGEQVADAIRHGWLDLVQNDLERANYAVGKVVAPACCVGAPHIRKRLWFVADRPFDRREQGDENRTRDSKRDQAERSAGRTSIGRHALELANAARGGSGASRTESRDGPHGTNRISRGVFADNVAHADEDRFESRGKVRSVREKQNAEHGRPTLELAHTDHARQQGWGRAERSQLWQDGSLDALRADREPQGTRPTDGFWRDVDWLLCRDGRWRCSKPGIKPLVDGLPVGMGSVRAGETNPYRTILDPKSGRAIGQAPWRVGMLRAYGNAITVPLAKAFIEEYMSLNR